VGKLNISEKVSLIAIVWRDSRYSIEQLSRTIYGCYIGRLLSNGPMGRFLLPYSTEEKTLVVVKCPQELIE